MPSVYGLLLTIITVAIATQCPAGMLYTWKDAQGVTHITETPPPSDASGQSVLEYRPRSDAELKALETNEKAFEKQLEIKAANQKALNAQRKAQESRQQAAAAAAEAETAQKKADEFTKRARTNWRRYQRNKSTIIKLEAEADAARTKAEKAKDSARSASEMAVEAEKRAGANLTRSTTAAEDP